MGARVDPPGTPEIFPVEAGTLHFANDRQSVDKLNSSLRLTSMDHRAKG
jgi:hypothetical protein